MLPGFDVGIRRRPEDSGLRTPQSAKAGSETAATDIPTSSLPSVGQRARVNECYSAVALQCPSVESRPEPLESSRLDFELGRGRLCSFLVFCCISFHRPRSALLFLFCYRFSFFPPVSFLTSAGLELLKAGPADEDRRFKVST